MQAHNILKSKTLPPINASSSAFLPSLLSKKYALDRNSLLPPAVARSPKTVWMLVKASISWILMLSMCLSMLWFYICVLLVDERSFSVDVEVEVLVLLGNW